MATVEALLGSAAARLRASGSATPRLDAELLLGLVLGIERTALLAHPEAVVGDGPGAAFAAALVRREAGEPVAYIRGFKEFRGLALSVDARVLIPRPETERLVELVEAEVVRRLIGAPRPAGTPPLRIVDVGTGSGAVAVSLAISLRRRRMLEDVDILATDIAPAALGVATENAVGHAVADRVHFVVADLLPPVVASFDVLAANLPYVRSDTMPGLPVATSFEPPGALDGGPDGLDVVRRLLARLPDALAPDGTAFLEIGGDQGKAIVEAVAGVLPGWSCAVEADLGGLPRVAVIRR